MNIIGNRFTGLCIKPYRSEYVNFFCSNSNINSKDLSIAKNSNLKPDIVKPKFDDITHTGQAWDENDRRLVRFTYSKKIVNPNIAAHLIAEQKPIPCDEHVVSCNGGHSSLGHPRVFINLDKPGTHACGYCGLRYYNTHSTKPEDLESSTKAYIQV